MRGRHLLILALTLIAAMAVAWVVFAPRAVRAPALEDDVASVCGQNRGGMPGRPNNSPGTVIPEGTPGRDLPGCSTTPGSPPKHAPDSPTPQPKPEVRRQPDEALTTPEAGTHDNPVVPVVPGGPLYPPRPRFIVGEPKPRGQNQGSGRPEATKFAAPSKLAADVPRLAQDRRGLLARYYEFDENPVNELAKPESPSLNKRPANLKRIDTQVYFPDNAAFADLPFSLDCFAAVWEGFLNVPEAGEYWFFLGADNAAKVTLSGETVLLNDVNVRYIEVSNVLNLGAGIYPIRIEYVQSLLENEDSWKCACNFMYVPTGQVKPVPVPPEMLLVPDWMWSDNAPIITSVEPASAAIGDEVVIRGQGLGNYELKDPPGQFARPSVFFNGQDARILSNTRDSVRVRVPIGASSGAVVAFTMLRDSDGKTVADNEHWIPSNSIHFTVTTQFGLLAEWYKLDLGENPTFDQLATRKPDLTRIEQSKGKLQSPWPGNSVACRCSGKLGVPRDRQLMLSITTGDAARVTLDGEIKVITVSEDMAGNSAFKITAADERYLPLVLEVICPDGDLQCVCSYLSFDENRTANPDPRWHFFPPVAPPKPPRISKIIVESSKDILKAPFVPNLLAVAENQYFQIEVEVWRDAATANENLQMFVDGKPLPDKGGRLIRKGSNRDQPDVELFETELPEGVGDGRLIAKLGLAESEPYILDVANKGLIAYVYDLPKLTGYTKFPDIGPMQCFQIRKDRDINFETAESFAVPFVAETFAIDWYGAIIIEEEGDYVFTTVSDDGVKLWIDGKVVIDHDDLHAPSAKSSAKIHYTQGVYTLRMTYFENNQHEVCTLSIEGSRKADGVEQVVIEKQVVPKRMFTWTTHPPLPDKVATGKKSDGSD